MQLEFSDVLADKIETIFGSQPRPRFYAWCLELNAQLYQVEDVMSSRGYVFEVLDVSQEGDNLHLSVKGDPDEVAAIESVLIRDQAYRNYKHCVVLEKESDEK